MSAAWAATESASTAIAVKPIRYGDEIFADYGDDYIFDDGSSYKTTTI